METPYTWTYWLVGGCCTIAAGAVWHAYNVTLDAQAMLQTKIELQEGYKPPKGACGDGFVEANEQCDDGNDFVYDGCTRCMIDPQYVCQGQPSQCTPRAFAMICGDSYIDAPETCDDGNDRSGDGCDASCQVEIGFQCDGLPSRCLEGGSCGNGVMDTGEQCDDGNGNSLDGCQNDCSLLEGWSCSGEPSVCIQGREEETSGSASSAAKILSTASSAASVISGESSASVAQSATAEAASSVPAASPSVSPRRGVYEQSTAGMEEEGWNQPDTSQYIKPSCGDGFLFGGETCDDGNTRDGDGCSASCQAETGFTCFGQPSSCKERCGDGVISVSERCDDGNGAGSDGCSASCRIEMGWNCSGTPSSCSKITSCGDGVKEGSEACDDGNTSNGDGCSSVCGVE